MRIVFLSLIIVPFTSHTYSRSLTSIPFVACCCILAYHIMAAGIAAAAGAFAWGNNALVVAAIGESSFASAAAAATLAEMKVIFVDEAKVMELFPDIECTICSSPWIDVVTPEAAHYYMGTMICYMCMCIGANQVSSSLLQPLFGGLVED